MEFSEQKDVTFQSWTGMFKSSYFEAVKLHVLQLCFMNFSSNPRGNYLCHWNPHIYFIKQFDPNPIFIWIFLLLIRIPSSRLSKPLPINRWKKQRAWSSVKRATSRSGELQKWSSSRGVGRWFSDYQLQLPTPHFPTPDPPFSDSDSSA